MAMTLDTPQKDQTEKHRKTVYWSFQKNKTYSGAVFSAASMPPFTEDLGCALCCFYSKRLTF